MKLPWPFHDRGREMTSEPFPAAWRALLRERVRHYNLLTVDEQARLEQDLRVFMARKFWEGGNGFDVTDEMRVTVSAMACLLTLGMPQAQDYYPNVESIIVYPSGYRARAGGVIVGGIVESTFEDRLGEAHDRGPVVLSWSDVRDGVENADDGRNLVFHEFAHKLDFRDGAADGVPRLRTREEYDRWSEVMSREYQQLQADASRRRRSFLSEYGATNPAEFFAVATEYFYEKPVKMKSTHPKLYEALQGFYGLNWAQRLER